MYAGDVAEKRGAAVRRHEWTEEPPGLSEGWVRGQIEPVLAGLPGQPLLIGKSLGSLAAGLACERSLPAVWLTPLLTEPGVVSALRRATAPFLLVGGTADQAWDGPLALRVSPYVVEVPAADHGMYVPGPLIDTIAVLARIVVAIEEFLDEVGWP